MPAKPSSTPTDGPTDGEPTTSISAQDASTTEGAKAAGVDPSAPQGEQVTKVQIEQAPPEPDILYPGAQDATDPNRPHVRADYKPFTW